MILAALLALLAGGVDDARMTVIVGATLVDGGGRPPVADSVVIIRGGSITAVGDRVHTPIPKGVTLVDGRRRWIAPGPAVLSDDLASAIVLLSRGPAPRVVAGQPAHLALVDGDPRLDRAAPAVHRLWIAGKGVEMAGRAAR